MKNYDKVVEAVLALNIRGAKITGDENGNVFIDLSQSKEGPRTKEELLFEEGFELVDVPSRIIEKLQARNAQEAEQVVSKIRLSKYYRVYENPDHFIIISSFLITRQEALHIQYALGKTFIKGRDYAQRIARWHEYNGLRPF